MRGNVRALDGDVTGAIEDYEQAMRYANELGSTDDDALIQLRLAGLRLRAGDTAGARMAIQALRADIADRSQGWERDLFADGMLLAIILQDGDQVGAVAMAADLRERLTERPIDFLHGHAMAVVGSITAHGRDQVRRPRARDGRSARDLPGRDRNRGHAGHRGRRGECGCASPRRWIEAAMRP